MENFLPSLGGYGSYARDLCRFLVEDGHSVHLFSRKFEPDRAALTFHKVSAARWPRSFRELSFAYKCQKELHRGEFDIVIGFCRCFGANLVRVGGGAHQAWLKNDLLSYPGRFARTAKRLWRLVSPRTYALKYLEKKGYGAGSGPFLIAVSRLVRDDLVKYHGIPAERIKIIYGGVNTERFNPSNKEEYRSRTRAEYGIGSEILVLFAANNFRLKGLMPLLMAVDFLNREGLGQKLKVMVVGKGDGQRYMSIAREGGWYQNLIFAGPVAFIERYYAAADIFVYPTFYDPFANVCLEALASGLPVITTRHNGASEIIEQARQGLIIDDPWDSQGLALGIKFFFDDRRRLSASAAARRLAEDFPIEKNYAELKKVICALGSVPKATT